MSEENSRYLDIRGRNRQRNEDLDKLRADNPKLVHDFIFGKGETFQDALNTLLKDPETCSGALLQELNERRSFFQSQKPKNKK